MPFGLAPTGEHVPKYIDSSGLPEPIVKVLTHIVKYDDYDPGARLSASMITEPVRAVLLGRRHRAESKIELQQTLAALEGQGNHEVWAKAIKAVYPDSLVEKRLWMEVLGWTISGQMDWYLPYGYDWLLDHKRKKTPLWTDKQSQRKIEVQLNVYVELLRQAGYNVNKVFANVQFADFAPGKAEHSGPNKYPPHKLVAMEFPVWPSERIIAYLEGRVAEFAKYMDAADDKLPPCPKEERWPRYNGKPWGVFKNKNQRATRAFDDETEAREYLANIQEAQPSYKWSITERECTYIRCESWCSGAPWCSQYQNEINQGDRSDNDTTI